MFIYKFVTLCLLGAPSLLAGAEPLFRQKDVIRNAKSDGRIVGGEPVYIEDFPHVVGYHWTNKKGEQEFCTGAIISDEYIVTAAHCVDEIEDLSSVALRVGSTDRTQGTLAEVMDIILHPNYITGQDLNTRRMNYDIALIRTKRLEFNEQVQPIDLPLMGVAQPNFIVVTGWGRTSLGGPKATHLMAAELRSWEYLVCKSMYTLTLSSELFCAAENMKGICAGDDGAPAIDEADDRNTLAGIALFQTGCGPGLPPAIFLKVSAPSILDFIEDTIKHENTFEHENVTNTRSTVTFKHNDLTLRISI